MSVANALLSQSVPSVVYTFRAVDDSVAEAFALELHRALNSGKSRAEAVRDAQLSLMRNHPDDSAWAAFALAGAPGPLKAEERKEKE
jgi:CHAT domain-containing protein